MLDQEGNLRLRRVGFICAGIVMVAIFLFSSQNALESDELSSSVTLIIKNFILNNLSAIPLESRMWAINAISAIIRKLAHFSIYMVLSFFVSMAFCSYKQKSVALLVLKSSAVCAIYAVSDELHQYFVPGRACQLRDVLIDTSGALVGAFLFTGVLYLISRNKKKA